jgi:general stress protein CsbA
MNATKRSFRVNQNKHYAKTAARVMLFSGSLDKQYSADAWIAGKGQGAMTWGFLHVMRRYQSKKYPVSYKRLLAEVQILLQKKGYKQIPHLCGGSFVALKEHFNP